MRPSLVAISLVLAMGCGRDDRARSADEPGPVGSPAPGETPVTPVVDADPACLRASQARTAPASLYDAFSADLKTKTGAARSARVDALLAEVAAHGGTPLEDPTSNRVVFLARGAPPAGTWSVVGSFNSWEVGAAVPMVRIDETDLWVLDTRMTAGVAQYKLFSGVDDRGLVEDPLANNLLWDAVARGAPGELNAGRFNALVHPSAMPMHRGRLVRHGNVEATILGNSRRVLVYLPPKYDDGSCAPLPSILMNDGNEALTRGEYVAIADRLYATTPTLSAVLVFVELASNDPKQRTDELTSAAGTAKGTQYVDFLAADLWPAITRIYRVCTKPAARGLAGASLGGLAASFAAFEKPSEWGWVGSQSAPYARDDAALVKRARAAEKVVVRFYLDSACPNDNCEDVTTFAATLMEKGYDAVRVTVSLDQPPDPHDWVAFKRRTAEMLTHFGSGAAPCN